MKSSLNIDLFFLSALQRDDTLMDQVGKRVFHTFRGSTAENQDKIPYLIVTADEANSQYSNKEYGMSQLDTATCSVLCVAKSPDDLAELTTAVLNAIDSAFDEEIWDEHEDWDFSIDNITPSADAIEADPEKPCLFRWMHFLCEI